MMFSHPPAEQIRKTISDFKEVQTPPAQHHKACACCQPAKAKSDFRDLKMLGVVVFAVTLVLVALNAYQRDMVNNDLSLGNKQSNLAEAPGGSIGSLGTGNIGGSIGSNMTAQQTANWGPGATQAAEMSFPAKAPTQQSGMYYTAPTHHQYAMVPMQSIRPSEPTMQIMAVPFDNGKGAIVHRLKRVVGR
ncbi:hypothetical protein KF913_12135 [Candidatus Obscuribacterales bacterium]|nr:hypothetical protein [Candidatus Obscuribacterales bacterium]